MTNKTYVDETGMEIKPATALMKKVAERTKNLPKMEKVFTPEEIAEILAKKADGEEIDKKESLALSKATRANKKWVKNRSAGDYGRIFLYPSYTGKAGEVWYKMIDFSALYFVYNLAERMGANVNIYADKDSYVRSSYVASVRDVESLAEKFMELGGKSVEITMTGIYILTLKHPSTAEGYANLMRMEEERRDRMHNLLRPAAMAPATYALLLDVARTFGPKIRHLEKRDFFIIGEDIMHGIMDIFKIYYLYSDGLLEKGNASTQLMMRLNKIRGGLAVLQEMDAWENPATATLLGETLIHFRDQVIKDFKIKVGKQDAESKSS